MFEFLLLVPIVILVVLSLKLLRIRACRRGRGQFIRNNQYIAQQEPNFVEVSLSYRDASPRSGSSYHVRVEPANGYLAWSSPICVNLK